MSLVSLIYFIMSNAVSSNKHLSILYSRSLSLALTSSLFFLMFMFNYYFFKTSFALINGLIYVNLTIITFYIFFLLISLFILSLTSFYPYVIVSSSNSIDLDTKKEQSSSEDSYQEMSSKKMEEESPEKLVKESSEEEITEEILQASREQYSLLEYSLIIQFILIGSITLLSCNDLITMFLAIELQSYGLYILSSIYRNSESSTSAGLTYFLLGGLSSCLILLGQSFLYVNSGLTNLDGLYILQNIITSDKFIQEFFYLDLLEDYINQTNYLYLTFQNYTMEFSFIILASGFLFKISAAPFHSWSPSVYNAVPTVTTTFIAIIPKIAIFMLFFDLIYSTWFSSDTLDKNYSWTTIMLLSSFLSLLIGSVLGLSQFKIKKLYAYSTISHVGFILLALSVHSVESIQAFIFYLIQYSLSNLNAFLLLIIVGYSYAYYVKKTHSKSSVISSTQFKKELENLSPIEYIEKLKGYFVINPLLTLSFSITLYSFIGIPPLVGFFAKQMVLSSALDNGYIFICLVAILTSVVSAVYYLYIIKDMFFEKNEFKLNVFFFPRVKAALVNTGSSTTENSVSLSPMLSVLVSILTLTILSFIFIYDIFYSLITILSVFIMY